MRLYCVLDCSVDLQLYHAGQVLDVSDLTAALLQRAAPTSFSTKDPNSASAEVADATDETEVKAIDEPPADKMVKRPARSK